MAAQRYVVGMKVEHPTRTGWGLGKVLEVQGDKLTVAFKGDTAPFRKLSVAMQTLSIVEDVPDPVLDNLPTFKGGKFAFENKKVLIDDAIARFQSFFPAGFSDPAYLGKGKLGSGECGERNYKWDAHARYVQLLGEGRGEALIASGKVQEATICSTDCAHSAPASTCSRSSGWLQRTRGGRFPGAA